MADAKWITKRGDELKPGDSVSVWWAEGGATLFEIFPYIGPLAYLFPEGASTGVFAANVKSGSLPMTVDHGEHFKVRAIRQPHGAWS